MVAAQHRRGKPERPPGPRHRRQHRSAGRHARLARFRPAAARLGSQSGHPESAGTVAATVPANTLAALSSPFTATLAGTAAQTQPDANGDTTLTVSASLSGQVSGVLGITLSGHGVSTGAVAITSSSASLGTANQPTLDVGEVTALSGNRITLVLSGATKPVYATANVTVDATGTLTGTIQTSTTPPA